MPQKSASPAPRLKAWLIPLAGHSLPADELTVPFVKAGFECHKRSLSDLGGDDSENSALLFWVGDDWERGFAAVEQWTEELRSATVLVGKRQGGGGLIRQVVEIGALAAVAFPVPGWFPTPLAAALGRLGNPSARRLREELDSLQKAVAEALEPQDILDRVAQAAARILGADLAVSVLKLADGARAIVRNADGQLVLEPWQASQERLRAPRGLGALIEERLDTLIVPAVRPGRLFKPGERPDTFEAAILQPIQLRGSYLGSPAPPLTACLSLFWSHPFLPTSSELSALEILTAVARPLLTLLGEQAQRASLHAITRAVFAEASRPVAHLGEASGAAAETSRILVEKLVGAYARWPGFKGVWVRPPHLGGRADELPWISFPVDTGEPPLPNAPSTEENPELVSAPGGWVVRALAETGKLRNGQVSALFTTRAAAFAARGEVWSLAVDLLMTYRLRQRAEDTATLFQQTVPGRLEDARDDLRVLLDTVRERLASDGAKVFVMIRDDEGPKIWQLANTDFREKAAPTPPSFLADRGMADWVIRHGAWLLIPQLSKKPGQIKETGWSGLEKDKTAEVFARPETEHWPEHPRPDAEDTMLLVPLSAREQAIGVLAVWRERPEPYDPGHDPGTLLYFAPQIAAACRRLLQLFNAREELSAIERLTRVLGESQSLPAVRAEVARGVRELANSQLAVLLSYDPDVEEYYLSALATANPQQAEEAGKRLGRFRWHLSGGADWQTVLRRVLETRLPHLTFRTFVVPESGIKKWNPVVALFDSATAPDEPLLLPDDLLDHYARSYLQTAGGMLEGYAESLASRLIDHIGESENWGEVSAAEVLEQAADLLHQATGAEAVILYIGTEERMTVRSSSPKKPGLTKLTIRPASLTRRSLLERRLIRVLDAGVHGQNMDRVNRENIEKAFGWESTGSWLCCPVVHRERSVGLIKLLTSGTGAFLGPDDAQVTEQVAERTAAEMYKASSREHWRDLLSLIEGLSGLYGQKFEESLVKLLLQWLRQALFRERCEVAIITRVVPESPSPWCIASAGAQSWLPRLTALSRQREGQAGRGGSGNQAEKITEPTPGVIAPLVLPVEGRLAGHLFVLDAAPFYPDDLETIEQAAQHIAFLVDNETRREEWRQVMGRFRHALLGPVQGLTSAAKKLTLVAETAGVPEEKLKEQRYQIAKEAELIRLWRENHRFYLSRDIQVIRKRVALRPLFERCVKRYRPIAEQRNIELTLDFQAKGELQADVDEAALDIALSNLLDNACKYAFYNRWITVGVRSVDRTLEIWVEDIGNQIPPEVGDQIYAFGQRGLIRDPLRNISGQGIGLSLVAIIVAAHDGELKHSCEREWTRTKDETEKTPYKVRFTVTLPWFMRH